MVPGQGTIKQLVFAAEIIAAKDKEGNEVTLGSKTIQCDNANLLFI
jgi:hypothetical protein